MKTIGYKFILAGPDTEEFVEVHKLRGGHNYELCQGGMYEAIINFLMKQQQNKRSTLYRAITSCPLYRYCALWSLRALQNLYNKESEMEHTTLFFVV